MNKSVYVSEDYTKGKNVYMNKAYAEAVNFYDLGEIEFESDNLVDAEENYLIECHKKLNKLRLENKMPKTIEVEGWRVDCDFELVDYLRAKIKDD